MHHATLLRNPCVRPAAPCPRQIFVSDADKKAIDGFASEAADKQTLLIVASKATSHGIISFIVLCIMFEVRRMQMHTCTYIQTHRSVVVLATMLDARLPSPHMPWATFASLPFPSLPLTSPWAIFASLRSPRKSRATI